MNRNKKIGKRRQELTEKEGTKPKADPFKGKLTQLWEKQYSCEQSYTLLSQWAEKDVILLKMALKGYH